MFQSKHPCTQPEFVRSALRGPSIDEENDFGTGLVYYTIYFPSNHVVGVIPLPTSVFRGQQALLRLVQNFYFRSRYTTMCTKFHRFITAGFQIPKQVHTVTAELLEGYRSTERCIETLASTAKMVETFVVDNMGLSEDEEATGQSNHASGPC